MKKFTLPEVDVIKFSVTDIITSSDALPITPFSNVDDELTIVDLG